MPSTATDLSCRVAAARPEAAVLHHPPRLQFLEGVVAPDEDAGLVPTSRTDRSGGSIGTADLPPDDGLRLPRRIAVPARTADAVGRW